MGTVEDRLHAAQSVKRRKLICASLVFLALGPLPLILTGNITWAGVAIACFLAYLCLNPGFCAPTREEIMDTMLEECNSPKKQLGRNEENAGSSGVIPGWTIRLGQPIQGVTAGRSREGHTREGHTREGHTREGHK